MVRRHPAQRVHVVPFPELHTIKLTRLPPNVDLVRHHDTLTLPDVLDNGPEYRQRGAYGRELTFQRRQHNRRRAVPAGVEGRVRRCAALD